MGDTASIRVRRYGVWKAQAGFDLDAAKISHKAGFFEWAAYQSIQSIEKQLKALISLSGNVPPKSHRLSVLFRMIKNLGIDPSVSFSEMRKIEVFIYLARYPFLSPNKGIDAIPNNIITLNDANICINIAERLLRFLAEFENISDTIDDHYTFKVEYFDRNEVSAELELIRTKILSQNEFAVKEIKLYGSFAKDLAQPKTTTMDLLITVEDAKQQSFIDRIRFFRDLFSDQDILIDCLVYTQEELDFLFNDVREGYIESAVKEGRVI